VKTDTNHVYIIFIGSICTFDAQCVKPVDAILHFLF